MNFDAIECWQTLSRLGYFYTSPYSSPPRVSISLLARIHFPSIRRSPQRKRSERGHSCDVYKCHSFSHPLRNFIQPILPCFLILSSLGYPSPNPMQTSRVNGPRDNAPSLFDRTKSPFPSTNRFSAVRSFVRSFVPLLRLRSASRRMELGCRCRLWQRLQSRGCIAPRAKAFHTPMHAM